LGRRREHCVCVCVFVCTGPEAWQQVSPEARLWLRHVPNLYVEEYCGHHPTNIYARSVALDPADVASRVGDWLLSTGRSHGE
jgi:hypothetical protein